MRVMDLLKSGSQQKGPSRLFIQVYNRVRIYNKKKLWIPLTGESTVI